MVAGRSTRSLDLSVKRFTSSPIRGWRWLFTFFGVVLSGAIVYVLIDWPRPIAEMDVPILIFPALLLVVGAFLLYIGAFAKDEQLMRFHRAIQRWGH